MSKKMLSFLLPLPLLIILACGLLPTAVEEAPELPGDESPPPQSLVDISGDYTVHGSNADGSTYVGEANITRAGEGYTIRWVIAEESMHGLGKFDGKSFRVDWEASWGTGEAIYTLASDGTLNGTWTTDGVPGQGSEELRPK